MNAGILAVNAGSSSLKFAIFDDAAGFGRLGGGEVSSIGRSAKFHWHAGGQSGEQTLENAATPDDALTAALEWIFQQYPQVYFSAIAHRIVHGGARHSKSAILDDVTLTDLESLDPLAPQHQPFNLAMVRRLQIQFPNAIPVGCFDTAFHHGWSDSAKRMALPRRYFDSGIRRYGFHGLSYEFLSERVRELMPSARRVVLAHLGSGASVCATLDGGSIDSTMGFSVLDGLPMSTRSGAIDPGVIFHLNRQYGYSFDSIERTLYWDSGLKGVSGLSGDVRELLASDKTESKEAIALFVRHCVSAIGAMTALLGGIDALVLSGGIGANSPEVRADIVNSLAFCGAALDGAANDRNAETISAASSRIPVFALPTDEEYVMARHAMALTRR